MEVVVDFYLSHDFESLIIISYTLKEIVLHLTD